MRLLSLVAFLGLAMNVNAATFVYVSMGPEQKIQIFRQDDTGARFTREVRLQGDEAWVRDAFHGTPIEGRAREGAYSLRHVSSAGGFSFAEWDPTPSTSHVHRSE